MPSEFADTARRPRRPSTYPTDRTQMKQNDDADLLAIPPFLRRDGKGAPTTRSAPARPGSYRSRMPPESMVPVLRAIKRGRDTMQKLRRSLGHRYSDRDLKKGIDALLRINSIHRVGRRYLPIQTRTPPPKDRTP